MSAILPYFQFFFIYLCCGYYCFTILSKIVLSLSINRYLALRHTMEHNQKVIFFLSCLLLFACTSVQDAHESRKIFFTLLSLSDFFKLNFLEMNFCDYFLNSVLLLSLSKLINFFSSSLLGMFNS